MIIIIINYNIIIIINYNFFFKWKRRYIELFNKPSIHINTSNICMKMSYLKMLTNHTRFKHQKPLSKGLYCSMSYRTTQEIIYPSNCVIS